HRLKHLPVTAVVGDTACKYERTAGIQRRSLRITAGSRDYQLVPQELGDLLRRFGPELQADGRQFAAFFQQFAHYVAEVDVMVHHAFINGDVGVAGHAEQALFLNGAGIENRGGVMRNQFFNKSKTGRLAVFDEKHPLKAVAYRDDAETDAVAFVIKLGDVIDVLIVEERERMA